MTVYTHTCRGADIQLESDIPMMDSHRTEAKHACLQAGCAETLLYLTNIVLVFKFYNT